jgi:hypothetical protein
VISGVRSNRLASAYHYLMSRHRFVLVPLIAMTIFLVGGCVPVASPAVSALPNRSSSPSPDPAPDPGTAARIQVSGTAITMLRKDGSPLRVLDYQSDPLAAIAALTTDIGVTPTTTDIPASACNLAEKHVAWGKGLRVSYRIDEATSFLIRSDATTAGNGTRVETPNGYSIGDPVKEMIAATPGVVTQGEDTPGAFGIRVFYDLDATQNGAVLDSDPKTLLISIISAPANVGQDC